jgi:hypothetical protein
VSVHVNVDDFVRAETARMFHDLQANAGGVNRFSHNREPASIDRQTVIRLNRDTLYSFAVVDARDGATLLIPAHGDRYLSVMVVDEDHYVTEVLHGEGAHVIHAPAGSPHVLVGVRILVDPTDADDIAAVAAIQDGIVLESESDVPFEYPDYDARSFDETREALLALARNLTGFDRMFGTRDEVDPVRHLIGTAAGWGGLPTSEAAYVGVAPRLPVGRYELVVGDVPVDGFWSISVYNAEGFFEPNDRGVYTVNSVTGVKNADGTTTVRFGDYPSGVANAIPLPEGWNYLVRMYRPRPEILDGTWTFPRLDATAS